MLNLIQYFQNPACGELKNLPVYYISLLAPAIPLEFLKKKISFPKDLHYPKYQDLFKTILQAAIIILLNFNTSMVQHTRCKDKDIS
jgi:hypothetical protein